MIYCRKQNFYGTFFGHKKTPNHQLGVSMFFRFKSVRDKCHHTYAATLFAVFEMHFQEIRSRFAANKIKCRILSSCRGVDVCDKYARFISQLNNRMPRLCLIVTGKKAIMAAFIEHNRKFTLRYAFALHGLGEANSEMLYILYCRTCLRAFVNKSLVALGIAFNCPS